MKTTEQQARLFQRAALMLIALATVGWMAGIGLGVAVAASDSSSFVRNTPAWLNPAHPHPRRGHERNSPAPVLSLSLRSTTVAATALRSSRTAATTPILDVGGQSALPIEVEGFDMPALARKMWRPMLATGLMAVVAGVIVGIVQAASTNALRVSQLGAWNPGLLFLGVGALLSAVTFLLAVILGSLRDGGAAVQRSLGARALVVKRPFTGKLSPIAMMMGLMLLLAGVGPCFVQAARIDTDSASAAEIAAWVGPLRLAGVALIISGVSLALLTIVNALRFQADRIVRFNSELHS